MAKTENNNKKVPGALIAAVVVIIAITAFVPTVYMPYKNKKPGMDEAHQEALDTIAYYDDSIANQANIEANIADLQARWDKYQKDMFVDSQTALNDLNTAINDCNLALESFSVGLPAQDGSGTVTAEGNPLYVVNININCQGTREDLLKFLQYVEEDSVGAYYVRTLGLGPVKLIDSDGKETGELEYNATMQISLYYFNQEITVMPALEEEETDAE